MNAQSTRCVSRAIDVASSTTPCGPAVAHTAKQVLQVRRLRRGQYRPRHQDRFVADPTAGRPDDAHRRAVGEPQHRLDHVRHRCLPVGTCDRHHVHLPPRLAKIAGGNDRGCHPGVRNPHGAHTRRQHRKTGCRAVDEYRRRATCEGRSDRARTTFAVPGHRDEQRARRHPVGVEGRSRGDPCRLRVALENVVVLPGQQLAQLHDDSFEGGSARSRGRRQAAAPAERRSCGDDVEQ